MALGIKLDVLLCCPQDGFAEENTIFGGYNKSAASASAEPASGNLRLLDNFTLYVQTDDEGSEELVDLQDLSTGWHIPVRCINHLKDLSSISNSDMQ